jgi:predicted dithiol-disulfide oxidoreductase (DUF899 family)
MTSHRTATREEWLAACGELLAKEKELTRRGDELAAQRRALPWVPVEKEYRFDTDNGPRTLAELFAGRPQLIVYHFMFGPDYSAGCPTCSSIADGFNGNMAHLNARGTTFTCISRAPVDKLRAYRERMGWNFPWASSYGSDYAYDMQAARPLETARGWMAGGVPAGVAKNARECGTEPAIYVSEQPVLNSYALQDGNVCLTYSTTARGLEFMMVYYKFLDLTPLGRGEADGSQLWLHRHDEYDGP